MVPSCTTAPCRAFRRGHARRRRRRRRRRSNLSGPDAVRFACRRSTLTHRSGCAVLLQNLGEYRPVVMFATSCPHASDWPVTTRRCGRGTRRRQCTAFRPRSLSNKASSQSHPLCKRPPCVAVMDSPISHVACGQVKPKCEAGTTVPRTFAWPPQFAASRLGCFTMAARTASRKRMARQSCAPNARIRTALPLRVASLFHGCDANFPRLREGRIPAPDSLVPIKPRRPRTAANVPTCRAFHLIRHVHVTWWRCDASSPIVALCPIVSLSPRILSNCFHSCLGFSPCPGCLVAAFGPWAAVTSCSPSVP
jgi:hypothetical protein